MIEKQRHITEMYELNHIHDKSTAKGFDYENNLYEKVMSPQMFKNQTTADYLSYMQKCSVWMINSVCFVRNFFDYGVDKYYDRHTN